jgi:beta-N-acetylhexosaminidase
MTDDDRDDALEHAAGQMLVVGFDGDETRPPRPVREALEAGRIGGVVLFERNIDTLEQVVALNERIHDLAADHPPPFVAIDQEGGRVQRIRNGVTEIPSMRELGASGDIQRIAEVSKTMATELRTLGFNLNFAPVLDVDTNSDNPVIGDRSFGDDPDLVARAGGAHLYGHRLAGVLPCGKHFPGHGDTDRDSHEALPVVDKTLDELRKLEWHPFEEAIGAGLSAIMTAHVLVPAFDDVRPATFSPAVIDEHLRLELGFDGVVVSDDLEMSAVADRYDIEEMIDMAMELTLDLLLICHSSDTWQRAFERLVERGREDERCRARILESADRVRQLKRDFFGHQPHPWHVSNDWRDRLEGES